jgi:hypothetical protein
MEIIEVNGKPAIRITGFIKRGTITKGGAVLVNCDGDEVWMPKGCVKDNFDNTINIQEWLYKQKFPKG